MENISLVTWVDLFIQDEILASERKHVTDLVNVHEMSHTYFGDLLVIRHFEHAWLKESWATYMESCKYILV
jgi:aminopeptidase N